MNTEQHLEADLIALCEKYGVPHMVVFFRNGATMCGRAIGDSEMDGAIACVMMDRCEQCMKDERESIFAEAEELLKKGLLKSE